MEPSSDIVDPDFSSKIPDQGNVEGMYIILGQSEVVAYFLTLYSNEKMQTFDVAYRSKK